MISHVHVIMYVCMYVSMQPYKQRYCTYETQSKEQSLIFGTVDGNNKVGQSHRV